jgi:hypothetical protein
MDEHWFRLPILSPRHWTPNVLWLCQRADLTASVAASRGRPQPWRKADRRMAPIAVAAGRKVGAMTATFRARLSRWRALRRAAKGAEVELTEGRGWREQDFRLSGPAASVISLCDVV